jgi:hypothetical protein
MLIRKNMEDSCSFKPGPGVLQTQHFLYHSTDQNYVRAIPTPKELGNEPGHV